MFFAVFQGFVTKPTALPMGFGNLGNITEIPKGFALLAVPKRCYACSLE